MRSLDDRPALRPFTLCGWVAAGLFAAACGTNPAPPPASPPITPSPEPAAVAPNPPPRAVPAETAPQDAPQPSERSPEQVAEAKPCPDDMVRVQHNYCADMERRCIKSEYDKSNRITICHAFAEGENKCSSERQAVDVCIDRYEHPNQEGGHPPVMVDFFDAERACNAEGKRLCLEREWISACEGPEEKPFPYGYERSSDKCNIDNRWLEPNLGRVYSKRDDVRDKELARLDQSVPSGAKPGCVSDFGVFDLTGNFDEWVRLDEPNPKARSKMAGLKGGAWGHVRNACRPVTTSHAPEFTYYFISFRCCKDVATAASSEPAAGPNLRRDDDARP